MRDIQVTDEDLDAVGDFGADGRKDSWGNAPTELEKAAMGNKEKV